MTVYIDSYNSTLINHTVTNPIFGYEQDVHKTHCPTHSFRFGPRAVLYHFSFVATVAVHWSPNLERSRHKPPNTVSLTYTLPSQSFAEKRKTSTSNLDQRDRVPRGYYLEAVNLTKHFMSKARSFGQSSTVSLRRLAVTPTQLHWQQTQTRGHPCYME